MRVEIFMVEFVLSCPCFSACKGFMNRFTISLTAQQSSLHGHPNQKTWIILLNIMEEERTSGDSYSRGSEASCVIGEPQEM
jgi:hypothetical protein